LIQWLRNEPSQTTVASLTLLLQVRESRAIQRTAAKRASQKLVTCLPCLHLLTRTQGKTAPREKDRARAARPGQSTATARRCLPPAHPLCSLRRRPSSPAAATQPSPPCSPRPLLLLMPCFCELQDAPDGRSGPFGGRQGRREEGSSGRAEAGAVWEAEGAAGGGGPSRASPPVWMPPELTMEEKPDRILSLPRGALTRAAGPDPPFPRWGEVSCSASGDGCLASMRNDTTKIGPWR
jgi:hypothetical protein